MLQKEIEQEPKPIVEGEEQPPAPEPLYETVEEISELGEHVIISNSKVRYVNYYGDYAFQDTSALVIRNAEREDSAFYRMQLTVGDQLVTHDFDLAVIDFPSKVRKLTIDEIIGNAVLLKWEAPSDCGNCDLIGYQE